jgi:hypothetical protein
LISGLTGGLDQDFGVERAAGLGLGSEGTKGMWDCGVGVVGLMMRELGEILASVL